MTRSNDNTNAVLWSYHPVEYHSPIFEELEILSTETNYNFEVAFGSDYSLKKNFNPEYNAAFGYDFESAGLKKNFNYKFYRNYVFSENPNKFFSRFNPGFIANIFLKKYQLIILQGVRTPTGLLSLLAAKVLKIPIFLRGEFLLIAGFKERRLNFFLTKLIYSFFDGFIYSSQGGLKYLQEHSLDNKKLCYAPSCIDHKKFERLRDSSRLRQDSIYKDIGCKESRLICAMPGRLTERKGHKYFLRSLEKLESKMKERLLIIIIGDGPEKSNIEKKLKKMNIQYFMSGFVDHKKMSDLYSIADIGILLSDYDPSPKVLNEMMFYGLSIICSKDVGSSKDMITQGYNGFIVDRKNQDEILKAFKILTSNEIRSEIKQRNLIKIENYSPEVCAKNIDELISNFI